MKIPLTSPLTDHSIPLVQWSLHKYKYLWGVGDKSQGLSLQEGASHTYTLRWKGYTILIYTCDLVLLLSSD